MRVDLVLLYVDAAAPGYRELHERHAGPLRPCQVRSLGELRFALRSLDRHAPWLDRLFLVVQSRAQLPSWLDPDSLRVVLHEEFIPAELLPTFSLNPIQAHLYRLPDLSEHYLLWDDDHFMGRTLPLDRFFRPDGTPRIWLDSPILAGLTRWRRDRYMRYLVNTARVLDECRRPECRGAFGPLDYFLHPHIPLPVRKSSWREMVETLSSHPWFRRTITGRTRGEEEEPPTGILLDVLYANWVRRSRPARDALTCLASQLRRAAARLANRTLGTAWELGYAFYAVRNDPHATGRSLGKLARERPSLFCINDEAYDSYAGYHTGLEVHPDSLRRLEQQLSALYPQPSRFERQPG